MTQCQTCDYLKDRDQGGKAYARHRQRLHPSQAVQEVEHDFAVQRHMPSMLRECNGPGCEERARVDRVYCDTCRMKVDESRPGLIASLDGKDGPQKLWAVTEINNFLREMLASNR